MFDRSMPMAAATAIRPYVKEMAPSTETVRPDRCIWDAGFRGFDPVAHAARSTRGYVEWTEPVQRFSDEIAACNEAQPTARTPNFLSRLFRIHLWHPTPRLQFFEPLRVCSKRTGRLV